jgi:hypothetical protein
MIGQSDNRNRRSRALLAIKNKIMGLDFVLAHRQYSYLATEQEKLDHFRRTLQVDAALLPAKLYRTAQSNLATTRCFVEKFPMFLSPAAREAALPVVNFCFVDEGAASLSGFETFLAHYGRLFAALPEFRVIYVADRNTHFSAAAQRFERFLRADHAPAADPLISRRLEYFEMRRRYEAKELTSFDRAKLILFRDLQREFGDSANEAAYRSWTNEGGRLLEDRSAPRAQTKPAIHGGFSACLLEHDYGLFGNFPG